MTLTHTKLKNIEPERSIDKGGQVRRRRVLKGNVQTRGDWVSGPQGEIRGRGLQTSEKLHLSPRTTRGIFKRGGVRKKKTETRDWRKKKKGQHFRKLPPKGRLYNTKKNA